MLSRNHVRELLGTLCDELGVCLSNGDVDRLALDPPQTVAAFVDAVLRAEWEGTGLENGLRREMEAMVVARIATVAPTSVHELEPGRRYRMVQDFVDHYGERTAAGTELTFERTDFLAYHDGYTLHFREGAIRVQGGSTEYATFGAHIVALPSLAAAV